MSDLRLAMAYLRHRILVTALTVLSVALGLALAIDVLTVAHQTRDTLGKETAYADLVVGGKGGPLQLVLNSLYYLDAPTGNISVDLWERLRNDPDVASVIPLTMGDNYFGSPIVGTVPAFLEQRTPGRRGQLLAAGRLFARPFEAVVGADVARRQRLKLGDKIVGAHGWAKSDDFHPQFPYTVIGILAQTASSVDRAVYTDYRSTWIVHSHHGEHDEHGTHEAQETHEAHEAQETHEAHEAHGEAPGGHEPTREVTALLVRLSQPARRYLLVQDINKHEQALAVVPVDEISKLITVFLAPLQGLLLAVAYLVVIVAALTILISLYLTIHQRRRDLAIARALGATRGDVFRLIAVEAGALSGLGVVCGWVLGHALIAVAAGSVMSRFGIYPNAWQVSPLELAIVASVWGLGVIAGLLPAAIAYRLPVADNLVKE